LALDSATSVLRRLNAVELFAAGKRQRIFAVPAIGSACGNFFELRILSELQVKKSQFRRQ
jgi:hypothetical protein